MLLFLLMPDTVIDLNDKNVFTIWLTIAIVKGAKVPHSLQCFPPKAAILFPLYKVI